MDRASATPQTPSKAHWILNGISTTTCESAPSPSGLELSRRSALLHFYQTLRLVSSYIGKTDSITISIWNHKKIHKRQGAGFLGCIRLLSNAISRLKDTGCKSDFVSASDPKGIKEYFAMDFLCLLPPDQRLDLCKLNPSDSDAVRGQIVGKDGRAVLQNLCLAHVLRLHRHSVFSQSTDARPYRQRGPRGGLQRAAGE